MPSEIFVIMGVSGCGKSTVGAQLARTLRFKFMEGDTLHSAASVVQMTAGIPLNDSDRIGWLHRLAEHIARAYQTNAGLVLSCSALKRSYRDILRQGSADICFIYLHGERKLLEQRMGERSGHYMPISLLESQLSILEPPGADENSMRFDVAMTSEEIVAAIARASSLEGQ